MRRSLPPAKRKLSTQGRRRCCRQAGGRPSGAQASVAIGRERGGDGGSGGAPATTPPVAAKSLPVLATAGDVREVVQFLKKRPKGVTIIEAMDADKKRTFEPRKVSAYEFWGIILRSGDRLRLSQLGWEFARRIEPEAHVYRAVLDNSAPYRAVLEWIHRQSLEIVTQTNVAAYWTNHHREALDQNNERIVEGNVVCFFHLCQAAELGTVTIGKRGQPARLRVDRDELLAYIEARPLTAVAGEPYSGGGGAEAPSTPADEFSFSPRPQALAEAAARPRVFLSHAGSANIVGQILLALELTDIEGQVVERERSAGHPVPAGVVQMMRQCSAGLIVVTASDFAVDAAGAYVLNEAIRNEISAACCCSGRNTSPSPPISRASPAGNSRPTI